MSYNVLEVCRYVINYSNEHDYGISNLKLQKVLYFIQAYFLTNKKTHTPCFDEKIEAWDFGPVVPEAYHEYKQYGSGDIPTVESYILFDEDDIWNSKRVAFNDNVIKDEDKILIDKVVDKFSEYSATDLVSLTHRQSPWIDAYAPYQNKLDRILYSEISNYVFSLEMAQRGVFATNLEKLLLYSLNDKNNVAEDSKKLIIKIYDHFQLALHQIENVNNIFAAIVLAFVGGITFSTSVLQNIAAVSEYKLLLVVDFLAFVLINVIYILVKFIFAINEKNAKIFNIKVLNIACIDDTF